MEEKYNSHKKQPRGAYHKQLHNTKMKSGDDHDDCIYSMDDNCERLEVMGQPVPDKRYEETILEALPVEYERVFTASHERRDFHFADIGRVMSALYIDCLSRSSSFSPVEDPGVSMKATGGDDSVINSHYFGNPGHHQKNALPISRPSAKR